MLCHSSPWSRFAASVQAVALVSGVEQRLGSKLKRSAERRAAAEVEFAERGRAPVPASRRGFNLQQPGPSKKQRRGDNAAQQRQQQAQQPAAAAARQAEEETDSEEEEGRGSWGKGRHASNRPASFTRADLLKTTLAAQGKKKKKKRKRGKNGQAAQASA